MALPEEGMPLAQLLKQIDLVKSNSEARRLIQQGGVKIDGEKISNPNHIITASVTSIYQVGKRRFARVSFR